MTEVEPRLREYEVHVLMPRVYHVEARSVTDASVIAKDRLRAGEVLQEVRPVLEPLVA